MYPGTYSDPSTTSTGVTSGTTLTNVTALSAGGEEEEGSEEINPTQDEMERERLMAKAEQVRRGYTQSKIKYLVVGGIRLYEAYSYLDW